ncbi:type IV secretory system conjugative DNA transfer family protein [Hyphobacterium sp.]|uniref:type IV secretory system conjugative DNA transfer family protein n=1 Tax=Hyphobacterium sp. TaxID=2004662 RepID=UPI00374A25D9
MSFEQNEHFRHGSARPSTADDVEQAGYFKGSMNAFLVGHLNGRAVKFSGQGSGLVIAGARGGKGSLLGFSLADGAFGNHLVSLDPKAEGAYCFQNQAASGKYNISWNPAGLLGLPQHRINPVDYIRADSPSVVADAAVWAENWMPPTGASNAVYFESRGREKLTAFALTLAELDGALTLPRLYEVVNAFVAGESAWLDFAFEMSESRFPLCRRVEAEIATARENPSGGFHGIVGELLRSFSCLADPMLMASVSPPYDFSFADLCFSAGSGKPVYKVDLCPPAEYLSTWAPVIRSMFTAGMIYKARSPVARPQTWVLDECAQLGSFPLVPKLFVYGAGIGIRPWAIYQTTQQMALTGSNVEAIITSSAAVRSYFAVRDLSSAQTVSRMLGAQTLEYNDDVAHQQARRGQQEALSALLSGGDPLDAALRFDHFTKAEAHRSKQQRWLRTPDEILNTPPGYQYLFMDGLPGGLYAERRNYYEARECAGRFHPNPYQQSDLSRVKVKTRFGWEWRRVIREKVPPRFAHLPQYAGGEWSYVEGFKP